MTMTVIVNDLCWRMLEQRRADSRVNVSSFKIVSFFIFFLEEIPSALKDFLAMLHSRAVQVFQKISLNSE